MRTNLTSARASVRRLGLLGLACIAFVGQSACGRDEPAPPYARRALVVENAGVVPLTLAAAETLDVAARVPRFGHRVGLQLWDVQAKAVVARAEAGWFGYSTELELQNTGATPRDYLLVIERPRRRPGKVELLRAGRSWRRGVVAGVTLAVPRAAGHVVQVAAVPGGLRALALYAFDCEGRLVAVDRASGPTGLPRIAGAGEVCRVMLDGSPPVVGAAAASAATAASGSAKPIGRSASGKTATRGADGARVNARARGAARSQASEAPRDKLDPPAATGGIARVSLYVNDGFDRDGDGLGNQLEQALATCDDPAEPSCAGGPLADYYREVRQATRDSDRDGLSDADEVLGKSPRLDLPRFGADPRHKDVFVEVDPDSRLADLGWSEAEFAAVAARYAQGSARELKNPSGQPGVRLHFDAGFEPDDPAHLTLLGDWGGSRPAKALNYRNARAEDFTSERAGYFRYAYLTRSGRGQARRDAFTVNRDLPQRVAIFAHELGHTLGLEHHGADEWGQANCKPNYFSIMNYVYQNRDDIGFSRMSGEPLDPAAVREDVPLPEGVDPAVLRDSPLELDVLEDGIDWNRDGLISAEPVRAGLNWATYKSCGAAAHGRTTLRDARLAEVSPVLTRLRDRLYALLVDESGHVYVRHGPLSGPDAGGSCPEGDGANTRCTDWSMESLVHGLDGVRRMAAVRVADDQLALAYTREDAELRVALLVVAGEVLELRSDVAVAARTEHTPALAILPVSQERYGVGSLFRVIFRAQGSTGELLQASALGADGPFQLAAVRGEDLQPLASGLAPSMARLGTGEDCAVFPDLEGYVRFYCHEPVRDVWLDLTARAFYEGLGPHSAGPVGIAYHRYRHADGTPVTADGTRGAVVLSFTEPESSYAKNPDNPHFYVSEWLSAAAPARQQLSFRWRGSVIDEWTNLVPGSSVALYEDEGMSALKALMLTRGGSPEATRLEFLPFADGAHEDQLGAGNDFERMEQGICAGIRDALRCGSR